MSYSVSITPEAKSDLDKSEPIVRDRIVKWMDSHLGGCRNPRRNAKPLGGRYAGKYRFRPLRNYRVCVSIDDKDRIILILAVRDRERAYH